MEKYKERSYRNVFKEIGKSDEAINKKIEEAFDIFFYDEKESKRVGT